MRHNSYHFYRENTGEAATWVTRYSAEVQKRWRDDKIPADNTVLNTKA